MRYVVDAATVLRLLGNADALAGEHRLVAPTLLRSEVLDVLYRSVRNGDRSEAEGLDLLERFAGLRVRYLGDRVSRREAWRVAMRRGHAGTGPAESIAMARLQADALITEDASLAADAAAEGVEVASYEALLTS